MSSRFGTREALPIEGTLESAEALRGGARYFTPGGPMTCFRALYLSALFAGLAASPAPGQVTVGVKAGASLSDLIFTGIEINDREARRGFVAGASLTVPVSGPLGLKFEGSLCRGGRRSHSSNWAMSDTRSTTCSCRSSGGRAIRWAARAALHLRGAVHLRRRAGPDIPQPGHDGSGRAGLSRRVAGCLPSLCLHEHPSRPRAGQRRFAHGKVELPTKCPRNEVSGQRSVVWGTCGRFPILPGTHTLAPRQEVVRLRSTTRRSSQ